MKLSGFHETKSEFQDYRVLKRTTLTFCFVYRVWKNVTQNFMKTFVYKLSQLLKAIEEQRGEFTLFALALPEDTIAWDMLVSAKWIDKDRSEALRYLVKEVQSITTKQELLNLSGILLFDTDKVAAYGNVSERNEMGREENNTELFGRQIKKAYIFVSPVADFQLAPSR